MVDTKHYLQAFRIGTLTVYPNILVAPMAGYTDLAYRRIVGELGGAGMAYTELISCHTILHAGPKTFNLIATTAEEHPLGMQIFGSDPEMMAASASLLEDYGADLIDINMGCPVSKVVKTGGGAVLMKDPERAEAIVQACARAVTIPVTVKIRTGWDEQSRNAPEFARRMAGAGAQAIAVHGRTRAQGYAGTAHWPTIREVVEAVDVPVIGNGDVVDGRTAQSLFEETGCAGIMIGRAAMGAPWIFREVFNYLSGSDETGTPNPEERGRLALRHLHYLEKLYGEKIACLHIRRIACCYARGLPEAKEFRRTVVKVSTIEEARIIIVEYFARALRLISEREQYEVNDTRI